MKRILSILWILTLLALVREPCYGQEKTVGVLSTSNEVTDGYVMFHPIPDKNIYLINNCGQTINTWETDYKPGHSVYFQDDGSIYYQGALINPLIVAGGAGGVIERQDWEGNITWRFEYSDQNVRAHHDYQILPNGNLLILAWEYISKDDAIANGRNPALISEDALWPEHIIELEPTGAEGGNIVWEWHSWDHLIQDFDDTKPNFGVVSDHPEKIDVNYILPGRTDEDWHHANALNYNAELDQIMISVLHFDEIWIIDHNTTTEEAQGPKGDLIFRWGNPKAYGRGTDEDRQLFGQHDAQWIQSGLPDAGKIMIFNNGRDRPDGQYSSVVKIAPTFQDGQYQMNQDGQFLPESYFYEYTAPNPTDFYSRFLSGAQQLPNGNILVNAGAFGTFFEFNQAEEIVWEYVSPITFDGPAEQGSSVVDDLGAGTNILFRATRILPDHPGFIGKDLTPGDLLELNGDTEFCTVLDAEEMESIAFFPNPAKTFIHFNGNSRSYQIISLDGKELMSGSIPDNRNLNISSLKGGLYLIKLDDGLISRISISK